jgi:RNA polymerase sigma-70 factor (ECF subfamily)
MTDEPDEQLLVVAAQGGDADAFARLVRRRQGLVAGLLAARVRRRQDVEDLAQEVFLRAWRRLADLREPGRFGAWIAQIAVHAAVDFHRRAGVRPGMGPLVPGAAAEPAASGEPVGHGAVVAEEHARVLREVGELDERTQAALALRFGEGLAVKDVAARLGDSPAAVAMRLSRALRLLRERLA